MIEARNSWGIISQEGFRKKYKPKVMIYGFGGTIAMSPDQDGVLKPTKNIEQLIAQVPTLQEMADLSFRQLENRDSTNITPRHWKQLARRIEDMQNTGMSGVIITHGTDTMAYSAGAVALALGRGLKIPVVFTGSQLPMMSLGTDARSNLEKAMQTIVAARDEGIAEVMITFSNKVLRGARTMKVSESKFDAFDSPALPPLASITATGVSFQPFALRKDEGSTLEVKADFYRHIFTVDVVPGLDPGILLQIIRSKSCRGLLLKSLGAGNVPSEGAYSLLHVIKEATQKFHIPVLVATKFVGGNTNLQIYEPGKKALDMGAIPTGDMTDIMAQVKLMWLLGQEYLDKDFILKPDIGLLKERINTDFVGEISK